VEPVSSLPCSQQPTNAWPIKSTPSPPVYWMSLLILSSHLHPVLPCGLFPSDFCTKTLYAFLSSPVHYTCLANLILIVFIIWWFMFVCTFFSKTLCLCSSFDQRYHFSQPGQTRGKIIVLFVLAFILGYQTGRREIVMVTGIAWVWSSLNFFLYAVLICWCQPQMFELCHIFGGFVNGCYAVILPCILLTKLEYITYYRDADKFVARPDWN